MKTQITYIFLLATFLQFNLHAQVGIGTSNPDPGTILDLYSTNKGLLIPRVQLLSNNDITTVPVTLSPNSPEQGTLIYNLSDAGSIPNNVFKDTFYIWNGTQWDNIGRVSDTRTEINNRNKTQLLFIGNPTAVNSNYVTPNYSTWTTMNFVTETLDLEDIHTAGTFTIPTTGLYSFFGSVTLGFGTTNGNSKAFGVRLINTSTSTVLATSYFGTGPGGNGGNMPLYWMGTLEAGAQIQIQYRMRADVSSSFSTGTNSNIALRKHF